MIAWVIQYWVQVLFGVIAAGFGLMAKKFWSMYQNEKKMDKELDMAKCYSKVQEEIQEVMRIVQERDENMDGRIDKVHENSMEHDKRIEEDLRSLSTYIEVLKDGVLSVQGAHFRQQCKQLLDEDKIISVDVFEQLTYDHNVYNKLGGNHLGDALYAAVEAKFKSQQLSMK